MPNRISATAELLPLRIWRPDEEDPLNPRNLMLNHFFDSTGVQSAVSQQRLQILPKGDLPRHHFAT